jgi:hypothetical protein
MNDGGKSHQIEISINRSVVDKMPDDATGAQWKAFHSAWNAETITAYDLAVNIWRGYGFTSIFDGWRAKSNFDRAWHVALDFDCGDERARIEELLEDDLIDWFSSFLYYTPSSKPPTYKSRVVFVFDRPISGLENYELVQKALAWRFPDSDQAAAEGARFFYGSKGATVQGNWSILPLESLKVLTDQYVASLPEVTEPVAVIAVKKKNVSPTFLTAHAERLLAHVANAPDGEKYATLRDISRTFGGYVAGGYYELSDASTWLTQAIAGRNVKDIDHANKTIDQGLSYGLKAPLHFERRYTVEDVR